ncbi:MAG TPA: glycosyltransferase [Gemmataceae bacterium]|nr:glycosyltransferase [Gemmataceae bacterium]
MNAQPVTKPVILYFGNDWAAENRTSSHHIARWLARTHRVFYIECPGLRAPKGSGRDLKKIGAKVLRFFRGPRATPEGLEVWTMLQIPLHRFRFVRRLNRVLMLAALRWLIWSRRIRNPITWFMLPHLSSVIGRLGEALSVYYCIDDYAALPDVNEAAVRAMDEETTRKADLVFIASETLLAAKLKLNPNTYVSPHGVDLHHFARAWDGRAVPPADLLALPHPTIGFFGLIEKWIDLDLLDYLATQRPDWSFVMIGRVAVGQGELPKRANIHFLGVRPYDVLPDCGSQFDVAIYPARLNNMTLNANPLKLREYLAMGKPIVSVATPQVEKYADVVRIARSREEFLAQLDAAIGERSSSSELQRRVARVAPESWDARLRLVLDRVNHRLQSPAMALTETQKQVARFSTSNA